MVKRIRSDRKESARPIDEFRGKNPIQSIEKRSTIRQAHDLQPVDSLRPDSGLHPVGIDKPFYALDFRQSSLILNPQAGCLASTFTEIMKQIAIVAKSNRNVFIGLTKNKDFVVISIDDTKEISLKDVLESESWGEDRNFNRRVKNVTKDEEVKIFIEDFGCSKDSALAKLKSLGSPGKISSIF